MRSKRRKELIMLRRIVVTQDKGGGSKSTLVRALAEFDPKGWVLEIEAHRRLLELGPRVEHCPVRASYSDIQNTGGKAARAEFDGPIDALFDQSRPKLIFDLGANAGASFFATLSDYAAAIRNGGIEIAVVVPVTAHPGAQASAATLLAAAPEFAKRSFVVLNGMDGPVDDTALRAIEPTPMFSHFAKQELEPEALTLLVGGGLATVGNLTDLKVQRRLTEKFGHGLGLRIARDLLRFRADAMESVRMAAEWLAQG